VINGGLSCKLTYDLLNNHLQVWKGSSWKRWGEISEIFGNKYAVVLLLTYHATLVLEHNSKPDDAF